MPVTLDHVPQIQNPCQPCAYGADVLYVVKRIDAASRRVYSNIWRVSSTRSSAGGTARQLTRGDHADHSPVADREGRFFCFVSNRSGTLQIWRMDRDGGEARLLTALPDGGLGRPVLTADGRTLVVNYTPAPDPEGEPPLAADLAHGLDPDAGPDTATGARHDAEPPWANARVEPCARVFVRVRNRMDGKGWESHAREQLWLVDTTTGDARRLVAGPWSWGTPAIGSDGSVIVTRTSVPDGDQDQTRNQLVRVSGFSEGGIGHVAVLARSEGFAWAPAESPDGGCIAFVHSWADDAFGSRNPLPTVVFPDGVTRQLAAELDRPAMDTTLDDIGGPAFSEILPVWTSADTFVVTFTDRGSVRLREQHTSGVGRWLTPEGVSVSAPTWVAGQLICVAGHSGSLPEIARVEADAELTGGRTTHATLTPLTHHNDALAAVLELRTPERVWIPVGGHSVHGWYLSPRRQGPAQTDDGLAPAILYVHGGPHASYGERLFFEMQWLAEQGYAVLWTNPRGSMSYGEEWCASIDGQWGTGDAEDLLAAADWLGTRPGVHPERVGLTGGSYGGYMALELAGTTRRFAAFVAQRGLFDWSAAYGEGDYGFTLPRQFGGRTPWQAPEAWLAQSPIRHVDNVNAPFLLIAQESDMRCEEGQSMAVFNALRARQHVPTAIVLFPEEGHGMMRTGRYDRRQEAMRQIAGWFDRYL